jgi:ABC-type sulfate transport system permease component
MDLVHPRTTTMKLSRLWQPGRLLFWQMLFFNLMSSVCTWAMRAFPLNTVGMLLLAAVALLNVCFGLVAAWRLVREEPPHLKG